MVVSDWHIRSNDEMIDLTQAYGKSPDLFSLEIHHGGFFTNGESKSYVDGQVSFVDFINGDAFSVLELNDMIKELGYVNNTPMRYHFKAPDSDFDFGLHALRSDNDFRFLLKYVAKFKLIEVYIEHTETNLKTCTKLPAKKKVVKNLFVDAYVPVRVETECREGNAINPTKGKTYWPVSDSPISILPPKYKVSIGRPKKKRRRNQVEIQLVKEGKLTRAAVMTKCGNCKQDGHNKRTCPKKPTQQASGSKSGVSKATKAGNKKVATKKSAN